ncbi:MAG: sulfotransferase [Geitlerinemataceae cyanobacterium]
MLQQPIFIGGLHRSGTSLMRAIVGSHPAVTLYKSDLPLWTKFYDRHKSVDLNDRANLQTNLQNILDEIFNHKKADDLASVRSEIEQQLLDSIELKHLTFGTLCEVILKTYARSQHPQLAGANILTRWGLKTPYNEFFADAIFEAYPDAKMVQMLRDPRDVAVSVESRGWSKTLEQTCQEWQDSARLAQINTQKYAGSYIVVRYEDLVKNSEPIARKVCQTLEIDYSPEMLSMQGHHGWRGSNSYFDDIGYQQQGISSSGLGRFIDLLEPEHLKFIQDRLGNDMNCWNYELMLPSSIAKEEMTR